MINLDKKSYFWKEFDNDDNPIDSKECQIIFSPKNGAKVSYLVDAKTDFMSEINKNKKIKKVYGHTISGEKFTLLNLTFSESFKGSIDFLEVEYSAEYVFYGEWIKQDDFKFFGMYVRYSYIEAWFKQMVATKPYDIDDKTIAKTIIQKEHFQYSTKDYEVIFNIDNKFEQYSINESTVTYKHKNYLAIARRKPFVLNEAIELSLKIKSFFEILTFYSTKKIFIEEFNIQIDDTIEKSPIKKTIEILFKQEEYQAEKQIYHIDFLFTYASIKENFVQILNNWIQNHNKNDNEFSAFCNVLSDKGSNLNIYSHFFQLVSALEGYHRRNNMIDIDIIQRHKRYVKRLKYKLKTNMDNKNIENIVTKLQNDYEPNFRKRLKELIELSDIKSIIRLSSSIHKSISNLIYDTRNDIAHSNKTIYIDDKIYYAYEYLKLVALLIMIKDISLNHTTFSEHIFDMKFKHLKDNLEKG